MNAEKRDRAFEQIKSRQFEWGARLPISWKSVSLNLKRAADHLYGFYYDAIIRQLETLGKGEPTEGTRIPEGQELQDIQDSQLLSVYFLLMGYAIEDLLKGVLMI